MKASSGWRPVLLVAAAVWSFSAQAGGASDDASRGRPGFAGSLKPFADFGHMPPPSTIHPERTFVLSQDYPQAEPAIEPQVAKILAIDYTRDWRAYADAVFNYILEGNIEDRGISEAFFLEDNKVRRWHHVPWQHWGDNGREGLHGLTAEGPSPPFVLGPRQKTLHQTYAVGFYNDRGGYLIGKVWADPQNPDIDAVRKLGGFPVGTVVAKLLFTTADSSEVDYLGNPLEWSAYIKDSFAPNIADGEPFTKRHLQQLRLVQMDMMVRDDRAKATGGWVFGTYIYNGAQANPVPWRNLVPLGIMWGNDPTIATPISNPRPQQRTKTNPELRETVISTDAATPPMHLGFGLRLSGAVDNTLSSCKSCHMTAQFPAASNLLPSFSTIDGRGLTCRDQAWMNWFRSLGPTDTFDEGTYPMDNSLQLAGSVQNFLSARRMQTGGYVAGEFWRGKPVTAIYNQRGALPSSSSDPCPNKG